MQVANNTSLLGTPFTITVDKLGGGCTTGVSMFDRAETILALADPKTKPSDLGRPGHINPLRARSRGVLRRAGHTEAAVDLARLAGLYPAGALIEIINEDGTMARLPQLIEVAKKFDIKIICIKDLISYRLKTESIVENGVEVDLPTQYGHFRLIPFRQKSNGLEHIALIKVGSNRTNRSWSVYILLVQPVISLAPCAANVASSCTKQCNVSSKKAKE